MVQLNRKTDEQYTDKDKYAQIEIAVKWRIAQKARGGNKKTFVKQEKTEYARKKTC